MQRLTQPTCKASAGDKSERSFPDRVARAKAEGAVFKAAYLEDVQFVLSRTNHHHHRLTKKGLVPLTACKAKGKKSGNVCKHEFPKEKQVTTDVKVICLGNAAKHGLRVRGKRNALGSILGRRNCPWLCGSARILTATFRSNTNTVPNYRVPIMPETHDEDCKSECLKDENMLQRLCVAASKAAKATTGYFGGYTSKRQPVGKYELDQCCRTLNLLAHKIRALPSYKQFLRVSSRVMTDLYGKGTLRTLPEEFNLASNMHRQDSTAAEFPRSYQVTEFRGNVYLNLLERCLKSPSSFTFPLSSTKILSHFSIVLIL